MTDMQQERYQCALAAIVHELKTLFPDRSFDMPDWAIDSTSMQPLIAQAVALAIGSPNAQKRNVIGRFRTPIFNTLFAADRRAAGQTIPASMIPLRPLALSEDSLFPQPQPATASLVAQGTALMAELSAAMSAISVENDPFTYLTMLDDALHRYTWALPAPFADDVSLYDYLRIAAGLAASLEPEHPERGVMLINGDISGVQSFIYTITARGATSSLRGRSLYLELLTDAVTAYILRELSLPPQALIYAGGAHFYLIAPEADADKVDAIRTTVSQLLLDQHNGQLYLALGAVAFAPRDFDAANFAGAWRRLTETISSAKRRRFSELPDLYERVFTPTGSGGDEKNDCAVCHHDGPDVRSEERPDGSLLYKCDLCRSLEALGKDIRNSDYLLKLEIAPRLVRGRQWYATLNALGMDVRPLHLDQPNQLPSLDVIPRRAVLIALSDETFVAATAIRSGLQRRLRAPVACKTGYTVNITPLDANDDIKSFEQLEQDAVGIKRLGVLRMDVDDLGLFFAKGFAGNASLLRTTTLSDALSLFFEGWVGVLARETDSDRQVTYSIYSGGDDLFIVGAWDVLPSLAAQIAADLQRYAVGNPFVHASAGISLHGGKYPLYQAADDAGDALDASKAHRSATTTKNALTLFDRTLAWEDYPEIDKQMQTLRALVEGGGAPTALLQRLQQLDGLYQKHRRVRIREGANPDQTFWGPWHYRSAYALKRMADRKGNDTDAIMALRQRLAGDGFQAIEQIGFAARWAELMLRKSTQEETS